MIKKKVCLLGAFGVGKTSLVRRFVYSMFDERYHSTIGVKTDKKEIEIDGTPVVMILWDIAGEEAFHQIPDSYLTGASGCFLVVDGTRPETLETGRGILARTRKILGEAPHCFLLNKADLTNQWRLPPDVEANLATDGSPLFKTSAKTGAGVDAAFRHLASQML